MGLDIWFREDVQRTLTALISQASRREDDDYKRGYMDALYDVALSFGIVAPEEQATWKKSGLT